MITEKEILKHKIIAISRGISSNQIRKTAEALLLGGVCLMEVTFCPGNEKASEETLYNIELLHKEFGSQMHIGAGTVLTVEQVKLAAEVGAEYIISPNTNLEVIGASKKLGLVSMPGAMTPTEAQCAWEAGADFVKIFPAADLGAGYIRAMLSSLSQLRLIATGGIDASNIGAFLRAGSVGFGVGGSLINRQAIAQGDFQKVTEAARQMVEIVQ